MSTLQSEKIRAKIDNVFIYFLTPFFCNKLTVLSENSAGTVGNNLSWGSVVRCRMRCGN